MRTSILVEFANFVVGNSTLDESNSPESDDMHDIFDVVNSSSLSEADVGPPDEESRWRMRSKKTLKSAREFLQLRNPPFPLRNCFY
ncbi:hypothetical protein U1Q18_029495 [Sarracenia purpurea var. burkii]